MVSSCMQIQIDGYEIMDPNLVCEKYLKRLIRELVFVNVCKLHLKTLEKILNEGLRML